MYHFEDYRIKGKKDTKVTVSISFNKMLSAECVGNFFAYIRAMGFLQRSFFRLPI